MGRIGLLCHGSNLHRFGIGSNGLGLTLKNAKFKGDNILISTQVHSTQFDLSQFDLSYSTKRVDLILFDLFHSTHFMQYLVRLPDAFGLFEPLKKIQPVGRRITNAVYHALDYISFITCGSDRIKGPAQSNICGLEIPLRLTFSILPMHQHIQKHNAPVLFYLHCELQVWMNLVRNRQHTRDLVSLDGSQNIIHIAFKELRARKPTRSGRLTTPTSPCAF